MDRPKPLNVGGFGKVYRPPLACDGRTFTNSHVGKVTDEVSVMQEMAASRAIRRYHDWADWACPAIYTCKVSGSNDDQIIFRYCGTPLQNLLVRRGTYDDRMLLDPDSPILVADGFDRMVRLVINFLPRIHTLNKKYIHGDMHLRNILQKDGTCYLIDFATMVPLDVAIERESAKVTRNLAKLRPEEIAAFVESHADEIKEEALMNDVGILLRSLVSIIDSHWGKIHLKKYKFWLASTRAPHYVRHPLQSSADYYRVIQNLATFM